MKNLKFISKLLVLLFAVSASAQMAVTDTGATAVAIENKANTAATLSKTTAMLQQITSMRAKYDSMIENIEVVNSVVASGQQISNIMNLLSRINANFSNAFNYITNEETINPVEKAKFLGAFNKIVADSLDELDNAYKVTTSGELKMSDAERLTALNEISSKLNHQNSLITYFLNKIKASVNTVNKKNEQTATITKLNQSVKK